MKRAQHSGPQAQPVSSAFDAAAGTLPIYRKTYEIIAHNIRQSIIPAGAVLLVAHLAEKFSISRAPVYQALKLLEAEGLVHKAAGHGYVVADEQRTRPRMIKLDLDATVLSIPRTLEDQEDGERLRAVPIWRAIYDEVEGEIVTRAVHGVFRVLEARLAGHYAVSRTVAKEVLAHLQMNGLVEQNASSQWYGVPMTEKAVTNRYDVRLLLEPYALRLAAPHLTPESLVPKLERVAAVCRSFPNTPARQSMQLEWDLHVDCLVPCGNDELIRLLERAQNYPIVNASQFTRAFHPEVLHDYPGEHRAVLEYLAAGQIEAAVDALESHLKSACEQTLVRLKIMAGQDIGRPLGYILPIN